MNFTGILGAHLHLFLTEIWPGQGGRRVDTRQWFRALFSSTTTGRVEQRAYGTVVPPRAEQETTGGATGTSSGIGRNAFGGGNFRGQGHRLG